VLDVVEESSVETKLDATAELLSSLLRIVHRQSCKGTETITVVLNLFGDVIVDLGGVLLCLSRVADALNAGDSQRDNGVTDAMSV